MSRLSFIIMLLYLCILPTPSWATPPEALKKCQACHGKQLDGKKKSPSIVELSYEELLVSLTSDVPKKMKRIAKKLTEQQKVELSKYIANLKENQE